MDAKQIEIRKQMAKIQDAYNRAYESGNTRLLRLLDRKLDLLAAKLDQA